MDAEKPAAHATTIDQKIKKRVGGVRGSGRLPGRVAAIDSEDDSSSDSEDASGDEDGSDSDAPLPGEEDDSDGSEEDAESGAGGSDDEGGGASDSDVEEVASDDEEDEEAGSKGADLEESDEDAEVPRPRGPVPAPPARPGKRAAEAEATGAAKKHAGPPPRSKTGSFYAATPEGTTFAAKVGVAGRGRVCLVGRAGAVRMRCWERGCR